VVIATYALPRCENTWEFVFGLSEGGYLFRIAQKNNAHKIM
jgi:hypothetical protein